MRLREYRGNKVKDMVKRRTRADDVEKRHKHEVESRSSVWMTTG